jgi:hypothetical protein
MPEHGMSTTGAGATGPRPEDFTELQTVGGILAPEAFRERFALATFPEGGIVVDVITGSYSRLNTSAALACTALESAGNVESAIEDAMHRLSVPRPTAEEHLRVVTAGLGADGLRHEPLDPFRYWSVKSGGYELWHGDLPVLHIDEHGRHLTLLTPPANLLLPIFDYVSAMAPKIIFLLGMTVLHGSSCIRGASLLGLCGRSRAGKTTTAKVLAKYGSPLVSEDLLLLAPDLTRPEAFLGGEGRVNAWAADAARDLAAQRSTVDIGPLATIFSGPTIPLKSIWFLDAQRRGPNFATHRLGRPDALAHLMANNFLGAGGAASWRRHLAASSAVTSAIEAYEIDLPQGLDRLDEAIKGYTRNSAS